ncbi:hypothetical protein, partial [Escherichia coli]|uniref:hypothetical protein n=1 Tax=Escherichia coli TaxID=562 RepID=UPI00195FF5B0
VMFSSYVPGAIKMVAPSGAASTAAWIVGKSWGTRRMGCNVYAPGEEQVFIDPEITGSGNIFRNNGKGDLCPPDYPWPPGFRK